MKKRLFAAFTALIMLLSVFAFASCEDESAEASSDVSAEESEKELTPRELFTASIFKTVADGVINTDNSGDDIWNMLTGSTNAADSVGKLSLSIDKPTLGAVVDTANSKVYYTDLFGLNEKPVLLDASSAVPGVAVNNTAGIDANVIKVVADAVTDVLKKNVTEDMFVSETKDVTVDGKTFQGATVITLDISGEKYLKSGR